MPSTYSSNLRLELIADGEQSGTWGQTTNKNLGTLLEAAVASQSTITLSTTTRTLTANNGLADESRAAWLYFNGSPGGDCTVTIPSVVKLYLVTNATLLNVLLKTASGTALTIPAGQTRFVGCDSLNIVTASAPINNPVFTGTAGSINGVTVGTNGSGTKTISTSAPSGGAAGDVWYQV